MATSFHINSRIRAYGKARVDLARRAGSEREFQSNWRDPLYPFPFEWGEDWKYGIEYMVEDFAAEVGFYIDVLGFAVKAFSPSFAQFSPPDEDFCISVTAAQEGAPRLPASALRLQWMIAEIDQAVERLAERGITLDGQLQPVQPGSQLCTASFTTPGGVAIDLFGYREINPSEASPQEADELEDDEDELEVTPDEPISESSFDPHEEDEFAEERDFLARTLGDDQGSQLQRRANSDLELEEQDESANSELIGEDDIEPGIDAGDLPSDEDSDEQPPARPYRQQGRLPIGGIRSRAGGSGGRDELHLASLKRSVSDLELTYTELEDEAEIEE